VDDKTFHLDVVTPRKLVFSGAVVSFSAPGSMGGFQILYNHASFLTSIVVGHVKVLKADGTQIFFATNGGFVEVHDNKVDMLADAAEPADAIDVQRAEVAKERAERRLKEKKPELDVDRARAALQRALNRLRVAKRSSAS